MQIRRCRIIETDCTDPYRNLAAEELLLGEAGQDELILFLWQNDDTIVIGRNQNAWQECDVRRFQKDGGRIARRLSGGGAVYHDLGNLNFTFLAGKEVFDIRKQLEVIRRAAGTFGIKAEFTGRNDLTVNGKKFSGNAYYSNGKTQYHHGTILIRGNMNRLAAYLTVSKEKLASKGVASVESRVINLSEICPGLTTEDMRKALRSAVAEEYDAVPENGSLEILDPIAWKQKTEKYASDSWNLGRLSAFNQELELQSKKGRLHLQLQVEDGIIHSAEVYSDAMDPDWVDMVRNRLPGTRFIRSELEMIIQ